MDESRVSSGHTLGTVRAWLNASDRTTGLPVARQWFSAKLLVPSGITAVSIACALYYNRRMLPTENDASAYCTMAAQYAAGAAVPFRPLWPPVYPLLGSLLLHLSLTPAVALALVSLLATVIVLILVTLTGRHIGVAVLPTLAVALCPAFIRFAALQLTEMLFTALYLAAVLLFLRRPFRSADAVGVGILTFAAYETRYIGAVLILVYGAVMIRDRVVHDRAHARNQLIALVFAALLLALGTAYNVVKFHTITDSRTHSSRGVFLNIQDTGIGLIGLWTGDGPLARLTHSPNMSKLLAGVALLVLCAGLGVGIRSRQRVLSGLALATAGYLVFLIMLRSTSTFDNIASRLLMPTVPLLVLVAAGLAKRWLRDGGITSLVVAAILMVSLVYLAHSRSLTGVPYIGGANRIIPQVSDRHTVLVLDPYSFPVVDSFQNPATFIHDPSALAAYSSYGRKYCIVSVPRYADMFGNVIAPEAHWRNALGRYATGHHLRLVTDKRGTVVACSS